MGRGVNLAQGPKKAGPAPESNETDFCGCDWLLVWSVDCSQILFYLFFIVSLSTDQPLNPNEVSPEGEGGGLVGGGLTVVLNVITYSRRRDSGAEIKAQLFTCENPLHH